MLISLIVPFKFLTLMNAASFIASRFLWCFCIYYYTVLKGSSIFVWRHYYILHNCRFFIPGEAWLFLYHFIWCALIFFPQSFIKIILYVTKLGLYRYMYIRKMFTFENLGKGMADKYWHIYIFVCFILNATYSCL